MADTPMEWPEDDDGDLEPLADADTRWRAATAGLVHHEASHAMGGAVGPELGDDPDEYPDYPCPEDPDGLHHPGCGCPFL